METYSQEPHEWFGQGTPVTTLNMPTTQNLSSWHDLHPDDLRMVWSIGFMVLQKFLAI